ncbi:hypothetical protein CEXT_117611 [Caerostris extrusa]|uniref:Uncharacterized protein n=1 Tax=Caerostris extrusa TaxID=172846 RepID=A0AAV4QWZ5_CAEEX|nr:hypothetical protein CEXT_117611 [Caerostris extrusa]
MRAIWRPKEGGPFVTAVGGALGFINMRDYLLSVSESSSYRIRLPCKSSPQRQITVIITKIKLFIYGHLFLLTSYTHFAQKRQTPSTDGVAREPIFQISSR